MTPDEHRRKPAVGGAQRLALVVAASLAVLAFAALFASFISYTSILGTIGGADSLAQNFSNLGVRLRFDPRGRLVDDVELPVGSHPAHAEPLVSVLSLRVHLDLALGGVVLDAALERRSVPRRVDALEIVAGCQVTLNVRQVEFGAETMAADAEYVKKVLGETMVEMIREIYPGAQTAVKPSVGKSWADKQ